MTRDAARPALRALGFNDLEAEVYLFLLASPPVTAYRIGRALGRATANVYKAVESLARRGAVEVEEGEQRTCRAVPVDDLARQLERTFRGSLDGAVRALADLEVPSFDERVYKLESVPRLFERCHEMLARAHTVAVIDAFPRALERIRPWILEAAARGVEVFVEAYQPVDLPGVKVAWFADGARAVEPWRSEQLNVVVDGREHLVALLTSDLGEIRQAVWSGSLYLSCLQHAGRLSEHTLIAMIEAVGQGDPERALRVLDDHRFFYRSAVPGQRELFERLSPTAVRARPATPPRSRTRTPPRRSR
jgi:sugar-specific transcriptional regulator TrmB